MNTKILKIGSVCAAVVLLLALGGAAGAEVTKQGINLSSGNLTWVNYVSASPSDILKFAIIVQNTSGQTLTNVLVRDTLPANLSFYSNVTVNGAINYQNISSGITIGSLAPGQSAVVTYQAQVAPRQNFSYGATTLNNSASMQSDQAGYNSATSNVIISVNNTNVLGIATVVSTGLTNNFLTDSFFLPLILLIGGIFVWRFPVLRV